MKAPHESTARFCWECGRTLRAKIGGGYSFKLKNVGGSNVRVHHECADPEYAEAKRKAIEEKLM